MSNVDRAHTHAAVGAVSAVAAAEQQPEGWRFVLDTILPWYQWAPQWVLAGTPTVHWGPIFEKAVGGPCDQTAQQYSAETPQTNGLGQNPKSLTLAGWAESLISLTSLISFIFSFFMKKGGKREKTRNRKRKKQD